MMDTPEFFIRHEHTDMVITLHYITLHYITLHKTWLFVMTNIFFEENRIFFNDQIYNYSYVIC